MADNGQQQLSSQDALANLAPGAVAELAHIRAIMEGLLATERYDILQVVVGDFDRREAVLADSPGTRSKRLIIPRPGQGFDSLACPAALVTPVLPQAEGALGRLIVNAGAAACTLYLASAGSCGGAGNAPSGQAHQRPAVWLAANGGSWPGLVGNVLYSGEVCAVGAVGGTVLTVAEF